MWVLKEGVSKTKWIGFPDNLCSLGLLHITYEAICRSVLWVLSPNKGMHWCVQSWKVGAKAPPENLFQPQIHLHQDLIWVQFFFSRKDYMYVMGYSNQQDQFTFGNLKRETKCFLTFSAALKTCDSKVGRNHSQAPCWYNFDILPGIPHLESFTSEYWWCNAPSPTFKNFDIGTKFPLESGLQGRRNFKKSTSTLTLKLKTISKNFDICTRLILESGLQERKNF